jgi:hypothetical protein
VSFAIAAGLCIFRTSRHDAGFSRQGRGTVRFVIGMMAAVIAAGGVAAQDASKPAKKFPTFVESDKDGDGFLTQAEWDASGRSPKRFSRIDADKDGKVSRAELREATLAARARAAAEDGDQAKP